MSQFPREMKTPPQILPSEVSSPTGSPIPQQGLQRPLWRGTGRLTLPSPLCLCAPVQIKLLMSPDPPALPPLASEPLHVLFLRLNKAFLLYATWFIPMFSGPCHPVPVVSSCLPVQLQHAESRDHAEPSLGARHRLVPQQKLPCVFGE